MSMTKQQKIGVCLGSAYGVIVLTLGWFLYSAYADHQAAIEGDPEAEPPSRGLVAEKAENKKFYESHNPFPSDSAIAAVNANRAAYTNWLHEAQAQVAEGNLPEAPSDLSGGTFKGNYLDKCLSKMRELPGNVKWPGDEKCHVCAKDKWFGFEKYMGSEVTPKKEDVPKLYKQFVTVTNVVDMLVQCGVPHVKEVTLQDSEAKDDAAARGASQKQKQNGNNGTATAEKTVVCYDYKFEFEARAGMIMKILNMLAKSPHFYVVRDFTFTHSESESLEEVLNRGMSGTESKSRRRRGDNAQEKNKDEKVNGAVTDPKNDPPLLVTMKLSVYDNFGQGESSDGRR